MNYEKTAGKSVEVFKENWVVFVVGTLVVFALGFITLGLLFGPLTAGLGAMVLKAKSGKKPVLKDLFQFNSKFFFMAIMGLLIGIAVCFGLILLIVPGLLLASLLMYSIYAMAYDNKGIGGSMKSSWQMVMKTGLWQHVVILLAIGIFNSIGGAVIVGTLITFPLSIGFLAMVYDNNK